MTSIDSNDAYTNTCTNLQNAGGYVLTNDLDGNGDALGRALLTGEIVSNKLE